MEIRLKNITFEADNRKYFQNFSFDFTEKKLIGITSSSKTDRLDFLLDMLYGIYLPTEGEILWGDKNIYYNSQERENTFYVSSRWMPPLFLRVKDFVDVRNMSDEVRDLLERSKIDPNTKLSHLNARQFFSIYCVQAIMERPKIMITDFFGASFRSTDEPWVFSLLQKLRGETIVILKLDCNSKNLDYCDSLVIFENGKIHKNLTHESAGAEFKIRITKDRLPYPWVKLAGVDDKYIARTKDLKDPDFYDKATIADATKFILMEQYEGNRKAA